MFLFVITINDILILAYRDFLEIRVTFLGSNTIIKEDEKAVVVAKKLSDRERASLRTLYAQLLQYLEMVGNSFVRGKHGSDSLALLISLIWCYGYIIAILQFHAIKFPPYLLIQRFVSLGWYPDSNYFILSQQAAVRLITSILIKLEAYSLLHPFYLCLTLFFFSIENTLNVFVSLGSLFCFV